MNVILKNNEKIYIEKDVLLKSNYLKNIYEEFPDEEVHLDFYKEDILEIIQLLKQIKDEKIDYQTLKFEKIKEIKEIKEKHIFTEKTMFYYTNLIKICDFLDISNLSEKLSITIALILQETHFEEVQKLEILNDNIITNIIEYLENDEIDLVLKTFELDPFYYKQIKIEGEYSKKYMNVKVSYKNFHFVNNNVIKLQIKDIDKIPEKLKRFENLQVLNLSSERITKIENLPENLQTLELSFNKITKIENLPKNLQTLELSFNKITKIENLPANLDTLNLSENQITKIPEGLPENLHTLNLYVNKIKKIENIPENLHELILIKNQITKIENIPENLRFLYLYGNSIKTKENIPEGCKLFM